MKNVWFCLVNETFSSSFVSGQWIVDSGEWNFSGGVFEKADMDFWNILMVPDR